MLFTILLIADLLSYLSVIGISFGFFDSIRILIGVAIYLIGKAILFRDTLSILDGAVGVYAILLAFGINFFFVYLVIALLTYKLISLVG